MDNEIAAAPGHNVAWEFRRPADFSAWRIEGATAVPEGWFATARGQCSFVSPVVRSPVRLSMGVAFAMTLPELRDPCGSPIARVSLQFEGDEHFTGRPDTIPLFPDGTMRTYYSPHGRLYRESPALVQRVRLEFEGLPPRMRLEQVFLRPREGDFPAMDRHRIHLHSHRRSGTHFLLETLKKNITGYEILKRGHETPDIVVVPKGDHAVHIYRDGRDVLVSNYKWWMASEESRNFGILRQFQNVSFADYVLGRAKIDVPDPKGLEGCGHLPRDYFADPIGYWIRFVEGFLARKDVTNVRYEDLKREAETEVRRIAEVVGCPVEHFRPQVGLTGYRPNTGTVGSFRSHFDERLHDAFWERAGEHMERWGFQH